MDESFPEILLAGGHANSLGRANEVISVTLQDRSRLAELFACTQHEDAWVRMRAIDAIEKVCRVHPQWLEGYIESIFTELANSNQASIQWHLAEIFTQAHLTKSQQERAIIWLENRFTIAKIDWIVAVNSMKALAHFARRGQYSKQKLYSILKQMQSHPSKSVAKKAGRLLIEFTA